MNKPRKGDLRVWWIPQVPMKSFFVPVGNLHEAKLILDTLADYDMFQLKNNIKPDFSNAGGLQVFNGDDWYTWYNHEGNDFDTVADLLDSE